MYSESIFIKSYKTAQRYFIVALTVFCPYSRYSVFKASETVAFIEWSTHFMISSADSKIRTRHVHDTIQHQIKNTTTGEYLSTQ